MRAKLISILAALAVFVPFAAKATVWPSDGTPQSVQYLHDNSAQPGDTITLPPGTFHWTQTVHIHKGITIQGAGSTVTHIYDDIVKSGSDVCPIKVDTVADDELLRVTGIDFEGGATSDYQGSGGEVWIDRISTVPNIRVDNCIFNALHMRPLWVDGSPLGVADHNAFTMTNWVGGIIVGHANWKNIGVHGDNSWADDPHYGSDQFFFIEDNTFNGFSAATCVDSESGMRLVFRYNTLINSESGNHGTETGQEHRGGRALEFYGNNCDGGTAIHNWMLYLRSGSALVWGNYSDRYDSLVAMACYRLWFVATPWGQADGVNAWDSNTGVVVATGTHTGPNNSSDLIDATKNWQASQWTGGYVIRNLTTGTASQIDDNTAQTIDPDGNPQGDSMVFNNGDAYEIRHTGAVLDQPGRGTGDLINLNSPAWPNEVVEAIHIWGNTLGPNFGNGNGRPIILLQAQHLREGTDYYYSDDDSAALPGYTPYVYPHPLVTGNPTPTPTPTPTPSPSPTPTPTPSASPTPSPTPTPTPTPTATPTPTVTPSPTPSGCTVPNMLGLTAQQATAAWIDAGFVTTLNIVKSPSGAKVVAYQCPSPGDFGDCSEQGFVKN